MPDQTRPAHPLTRARAARLAACSLLPLLLAGCQLRPHESRVRAVVARIDGITCPTCVPPLKASLRRQFDKAVAIDVDDVTHTAAIRMDPNQEFSPAAFREAVERVRMRVVDERLDVCGEIEAKGSERWLTAGSNHFLVHGGSDLPLSKPLCLTGGLDASHEPFTLEVTTFVLQRP